MADESIRPLVRLLLTEKGLVVGRDRTPAATKLRKNRSEIADFVRDVGKSGNLDLILAVERRLLDNDLVQYANSAAMTSSLKGALTELQAAEKSLPLVQDPGLYRAVDHSHGHPKSRVSGLPKDAVRQFFTSNAARLLNMDKARLDAEEKQIVDLRKQNMRTGEKLYADLQRQALGLTQGREQGMSR